MQPENNQPVNPMGQPQQPAPFTPPPAPVTPPQSSQPAPQPQPYSAGGNSESPLFGYLSLGLAIVALILIPIIQSEASSKWMMLIPLGVGLAAAGLSIFSIMKTRITGVLVLTGLIIGLIVASNAFLSVTQRVLFDQKIKDITVPELNLPDFNLPEVEDSEVPSRPPNFNIEDYMD